MLFLITTEPNPADYFFGSLVILSLVGVIYRALVKPNKFYFENEVILLITYIINSDGNVSPIEKKMVSWLLTKEFGKKKANNLLYDINQLEGKDISSQVKDALNHLRSSEIKGVNIQILYLIVKLSVVDKYLSIKELKSLHQITLGLGLNKKQLDSFLAMNNFISEKNHHQNTKFKSQQNKTYSYRKENKPNPKTKLQLAYTTLCIAENATPQEIKKSYRKLVKIYHPDKVLHLDKTLRKNALETFKKVQEAYELIKMIKGFS